MSRRKWYSFPLWFWFALLLTSIISSILGNLILHTASFWRGFIIGVMNGFMIVTVFIIGVWRGWIK